LEAREEATRVKVVECGAYKVKLGDAQGGNGQDQDPETVQATATATATAAAAAVDPK